jgi:hypothetical protein
MTIPRLNKVEVLEKDHPGLQLYVDSSFDRGISGEKISRGLHKKYGVSLSPRVLYKYRQRRWGPARARLLAGVERVRFVLRIMDEVPEKDARRALIYEQLFSMSSDELQRRDLEVTHLEAEDRKLDIKDKRASNEGTALLAKSREAKTSHSRDRDKDKRKTERAKDEDELRQKIDEIYGIGTTRPSPAPVSSKVD